MKSAITTNLGTTTTYFVGNYYEVSGSTVTKYYYAGSQRVAMQQNGTLYYLLTDHLGSTSLTTDASGNVVSEMRYTAWGEVRYASGSMPTKYQYTGQLSQAAEFGLLFYNARWYDGRLARFTSADSILPDAGNSQAWDRYAYGLNSPLVYIDPTGHRPDDGCSTGEGCHASAQTIIDDVARDNEFRETTYQNKCDAGKTIYCSYAQNHPYETVSFMIVGMGSLGFLETGIYAAGGAVTTLWEAAAAWSGARVNQVLYLCLVNSYCSTLLGADNAAASQSTGRAAVNDLLSQVKPDPRSDKVWDHTGNLQDGILWFQRIAKPESIRAFEKGWLGDVEGGGTISLRPFSSSAPNLPTLQLDQIPGLLQQIKVKFLGG